MRILLDCSGQTTGGAIQATLALLTSSAGETEIEWHGVLSDEVARQATVAALAHLKSVHRIPRARSGLSRRREIAARVPKIEAEVRPDVVYTVFGPAYWKPRAPHLVGFALPHLIYPEVNIYRWTREAGLPGMKAELIERLYNAAKWQAFRRADYMIAETETVRYRLDSVLGFPKERVFVARNTYSAMFGDGVRRSVARPPLDRYRIAVPAAYYHHKNLELIPHVAQGLRRRIGSTFEFVLTVPDDHLGWKRVVHHARQLGVADLVRSVGAVPHAEFADFYRSAHAVFLPTLLECSTAVYPEAFLAEVPLCTSRLDFAQELCGEGALYVDPMSAEKCAEGLARLRTDSELRERLILGGREALARNYATPAEKWRDQREALIEVQRRGRTRRKFGLL